MGAKQVGAVVLLDEFREKPVAPARGGSVPGIDLWGVTS